MIIYFLLFLSSHVLADDTYCDDYKLMYSMQYESTTMRQDSIEFYRNMYANLRQQDFYDNLKRIRIDSTIISLLKQSIEPVDSKNKKQVQKKSSAQKKLFATDGLLFNLLVYRSDAEELTGLKSQWISFAKKLEYTASPLVLTFPIKVTYWDYSGRSLTRELNFTYTIDFSGDSLKLDLSVVQNSIELKPKCISQNQHVTRQLITYDKAACVEKLKLGEFIPEDLKKKYEADLKKKTPNVTKKSPPGVKSKKSL